MRRLGFQKNLRTSVGTVMLVVAFGCSAEQAQVDPQEGQIESAPESTGPTQSEFLTGAKNIVLNDRDGASLTITCSPVRASKVYVKAGELEEFFALARVRFLGGDADRQYRKAWELAPGEADSWTYDDDQKAYEVSGSLVFLRSFQIADRVFIDLMSLNEGEPEAAIFDIAALSETEREHISTCLERNSSRVMAEMRALGIEISSDKESDTDPWNYDLDPEKFKAGAEATEEIIKDLDSEVLVALATDKETFISSLLMVLEEDGLGDRMEELVQQAGYETIQQWERDGNALYQAIAVLSFSKQEPDTYKMIQAADEEEMKSFLAFEKYATIATLIKRVPQATIDQIKPYYDYFVIDRPDTRATKLESMSDRYERFFDSMVLFKSGSILPELSENEREDYSALADPLHPVESLIFYYEENYESAVDLWEVSLGEFEFYVLDDWIELADRTLAGFAVVEMIRTDPDEYEKLSGLSDSDMVDLSEAERERTEILQSFTEEEIRYLTENSERVEEAFN